MNRRLYFAGIALLVALAAAATIRVSAAERAPAAGAANTSALQQCAEECSKCQRSCDSCAVHCADLMAEGERAHREILASCQDCAEACTAAARIVARGGPYAAEICRACADICKKCAESCDRFSKDEMLRNCAQECRKCEAACEQMLKSAPRQAAKPPREKK